ncbi:MAG: nucleotide sugar dehydrogenase [Pseudomonadota bacterium]|nr:nucleotide sugar dehydrogenase [Pseudomonadota bacterium]
MEKIAVIGLGYVGLPVVMAFAEFHENVIAYDIKTARVDELQKGFDRNGDVASEVLKAHKKVFTSDPEQLSDATFYVIAVPTPITRNREPDLGPVKAACRMIGGYLVKGDLVVLESTVYPGVTEEVCGPVLETVSGLISGKDFALGYSPERINPGDKEHGFANIMKVVAGGDQLALDRMTRVYGSVIKAGLHVAPNIKTAEAAKVLENTQRDLNVALMNELSVICDKLGISTTDVLAAAGTKWNFMPFTPGLVGGHCIGVDPYYLTARAQQLGYVPQVILAGRRINDAMGSHIAAKLVKLLENTGKAVGKSRVAIFGLSFKEDVSDLRNSRVVDIKRALVDQGAQVLVNDPFAHAEEVQDQFGLELTALSSIKNLDGLILAVPHAPYRSIPVADLCAFLVPDGVLIDVKSVVNKTEIPKGIGYWSL